MCSAHCAMVCFCAMVIQPEVQPAIPSFSHRASPCQLFFNNTTCKKNVLPLKKNKLARFGSTFGLLIIFFVNHYHKKKLYIDGKTQTNLEEEKNMYLISRKKIWNSAPVWLHTLVKQLWEREIGGGSLPANSQLAVQSPQAGTTPALLEFLVLALAQVVNLHTS